MHTRALAIILLALLSLASATACRSPVPPAPAVATAGVDAPPEDFHLGVTVYPPPPGDDGGAGGPRPGRYLLLPGGTLRAAFGPDVSPETFPPVARRLSHEQTLAVWRAAGELDIEGARVSSPTTYRPPLDQRVALVYLSAGGRRGYFALPLRDPPAGAAGSNSGTGQSGQSVDALVDLLSDLAWERL